MPNASARWATSLPMRPSPTTPSVLLASSTPSQRDRSHRPSTRAAWAWGTLRAWASSSAIVCSAAEMMFDCGAFTTITPRRVAASTSTLSRPMPARPTTTRSAPASSTSAVTVRGRPDDEGVGALDHLEEVLGGQVEAEVHLVAGGAETGQAALGDLFGDEDSGHGDQVNPLAPCPGQ